MHVARGGADTYHERVRGTATCQRAACRANKRDEVRVLGGVLIVGVGADLRIENKARGGTKGAAVRLEVDGVAAGEEIGQRRADALGHLHGGEIERVEENGDWGLEGLRGGGAGGIGILHAAQFHGATRAEIDLAVAVRAGELGEGQPLRRAEGGAGGHEADGRWGRSAHSVPV